MGNLQVVQDVYAAFARGDIPTVLAAFDSRIEWREAEGNPYEPSGAAWIGPEAVLQKLFQRIATDWNDFSVHPQRFHDAGETIVVEGRYTGTSKHTGQALDAQLCHLWSVRHGQVVRFQQFVDTAQLQVVLGKR